MRSVHRQKKRGFYQTYDHTGYGEAEARNFPFLSPSFSLCFSPLDQSILLSLEIHKLFFPLLLHLLPFTRNFSRVVSRGLTWSRDESTEIHLRPRGHEINSACESKERKVRPANKRERERERECDVVSQIKRTHLTGVRVIETIVARVDPFSMQHQIYIVQFDPVVGCTRRFQTRRVLFKHDAII